MLKPMVKPMVNIRSDHLHNSLHKTFPTLPDYPYFTFTAGFYPPQNTSPAFCESP